MSPTRPTALGAYIFQGSQTVGISQHFAIQAHFENGNYGVATAAKNFPDLPIFIDPATWPVEDYAGKIDLVYCNPPCAVFSNAGKSHGNRNAWRSDPRLSCYQDCFNLLETIRPSILTIESVTNAYKNGREFLVELEQKAQELGYSTTHLFVNALNMGVPQNRRRHFSVFHNISIPWERPTAPVRTVGEVLKTVKDPGWCRPIRDEDVEFLPLVKKNKGIRPLWEAKYAKDAEIDSRGFMTGRPRMMEARLPNDEPMGAFIGDFYIHPTEHRNLGVNEARALCCYPEDWQLGCGPASAFSEFARAVLPPVAEWLGDQARRAVAENKRLNSFTVDHVDYITDSLFNGE